MSNKFVGDFTKVDVGTQTWTVFSFLASNSWRVTGGNGRSVQFCNSQSNIADGEIIGKVAMSVVPSSLVGGFVLRYTDVDNYYMVNFIGGFIRVHKNVAGVFTLLGSISFIRVPNTYYWLRFRSLGDGLSVDVSTDGINYTPMMFINDSDLSTGKAGFHTFIQTSVHSIYFDDVEFNQHNPTP